MYIYMVHMCKIAKYENKMFFENPSIFLAKSSYG